MKKIQQKIVKKLKDGTFVDELENIYGKNLTSLSLWGAEPTLTLDLIGKHIPRLTNRFLKLNRISFSTSLITDPDIILKFIENLIKSKRKLTFMCQVSLDGPPFVTDVNRVRGAAETAPKNLFYIIQKLNKINLKNVNVFFSFKPTLNSSNIKMFNKKTLRIKEYFDYFETIFQRFQKENKNKKVRLRSSFTPTLVAPGAYTSEDGRVLAEFFKKLRVLAKKNKQYGWWEGSRGSLNPYTTRMHRLFNFKGGTFIKTYNFTCSAGDNMLGLSTNNYLHICHRTFFLNEKEYINSVLSQKHIENWDARPLEKGNINLINEKYFVFARDEKNLARFSYVLRGFHDFSRFKNSYIIAMVKELALCGQADRKFLKDDNFCFLFSIFINMTFSCLVAGLLDTGVIHFTPVSLIRLFGNGAFVEILKDYEENYKTIKG